MSEITGKTVSVDGENSVAMPNIKTVLEQFTERKNQSDVLPEHLMAKLKQAEDSNLVSAERVEK